jgi:hypothetical protein
MNNICCIPIKEWYSAIVRRPRALVFDICGRKRGKTKGKRKKTAPADLSRHSRLPHVLQHADGTPARARISGLQVRPRD